VSVSDTDIDDFDDLANFWQGTVGHAIVDNGYWIASSPAPESALDSWCDWRGRRREDVATPVFDTTGRLRGHVVYDNGIAYAFGLKADDGGDFLLYASTEMKEAIAFLTVLGG
jgi:hypothetical protein